MANKYEVKEVKRGDLLYPLKLEDLPRPPEKLYYIGNLSLVNQDKKIAAIVGGRKSSEYGKKVAMEIGKILAESGIVHISGMAKGIDSFGHIGSLKKGGPSIAVLGCGPDICYPSEAVKIYNQIAEEGLIISEYPPGTKAMPYMFPQRNRIIAALSDALVVAEASTDSGSLITAEIADSLGRMVYAVPGNITSQYSIGTNKLIADGALPLFVMEDLIRDLGGKNIIERNEDSNFGDDEKEIMDILSRNGEVTLEYLCMKTGKTPIQINGIVTILEMKGYIAYNFGKIFVANF